MLLNEIETPDNLKYFTVLAECGRDHKVIAKDPDEAIEEFYAGIKSIIGHELGICGCKGPERPLDRTKVLRPYQVRDHAGNVVKTLTVEDLFRIEKVQK
jgi:hypothetical protein